MTFGDGAPPQVFSDATGAWSPLIARIAFRALVRQRPDDEQVAFDALIRSGCPVGVAQGAWEAWRLFRMEESGPDTGQSP